MLRSLKKVNVEFGLVAMAHNLRKIAKLISLNPIKYRNNKCNTTQKGNMKGTYTHLFAA